MSLAPRTRLVNPRLGVYFGIFASALAGLVLLLLMFEQMGARGETLRFAMLAGPVILYVAIGVAAYTREPLDYFTSGRRVPAVYTGLNLAVTALGATGLVSVTGAFFLIGFDALCLLIGGLAGFVAMAVLLAPFVRKFGAYTLPSYLGRRFDSRALRLASAMVMSVPLLLFLVAELKLGATMAAHLSSGSDGAALALVALVLALSLLAGGMRSLTWSNVAQSIAAILALIVPVAIVAVLVTNLPLPQLSHGPLVRQLLRAEAVQAIPMADPGLIGFWFPGEGIGTIAKRFTQPYGVVGPLAFVIVSLTVMAGVAGSPWLLPRVAASPGVYDARKSLGWATCFFGVVMLTMTSVAVFMRDSVMDIIMVEGAQQVPKWLRDAVTLGFARVDTQAPRLELTGIGFDRDAVLLSLPVAIGLPTVFLYLAAAGALAAALAAAGGTLLTLANLVSEDIVHGLSWEPPRAQSVRIGTSRAALLAALLGGVLIAHLTPSDPLKLLLWALALTAAAVTPVLVLSIWWKRMNAFGALAGVVAGFAVAVLVMLGSLSGLMGIDGALGAAAGAPAALIATIAVSLMTPHPGRHELELVRDIRVPGGEVLYDREMRMLRLRNRRSA